MSKWPLGINPEMDAHAVRRGFAHWSCTSKSSNEHWIRRDGFPYKCIWSKGSYPSQLRSVDAENPIEQFVFGVSETNK